MTIQVSNSEVQCFKECRRRWWLSYYRSLRRKSKRYTGALALGTRVHAALERKYGYGEDLLTAHAALIAQDRSDMVMDLLDSTELDAEADLGRIMLEGYEQWVDEEGLDNYIRIIGTEQKLSMPMFDGSVELIGKIDLRVQRTTDNARSVLDFKTAQDIASFTRQAAMSEQLITYILLDQTQDDEDRVDGALYRILRKVKRSARANPPFYEQVEIRHNVFTLRTFWQRIHGVVADMMRVRAALDEGSDPHNVAYPTPTANCSWKCEFFSVCTLFDDGSAAEAALDIAYEVHDPYERYDPEAAV